MSTPGYGNEEIPVPVSIIAPDGEQETTPRLQAKAFVQYIRNPNDGKFKTERLRTVPPGQRREPGGCSVFGRVLSSGGDLRAVSPERRLCRARDIRSSFAPLSFLLTVPSFFGLLKQFYAGRVCFPDSTCRDQTGVGLKPLEERGDTLQ